MATVQRGLAFRFGRGEPASVVTLQEGLAVIEQDVLPHHVQQAVVETTGGAGVLVAARTHRGDAHAGLEERDDIHTVR